MALDVSWVGWHSPIAPRGQPRRGHRDQASERSRDAVVGRVTLEVQGDKKQNGLAAASIFFRAVSQEV